MDPEKEKEPEPALGDEVYVFKKSLSFPLQFVQGVIASQITKKTIGFEESYHTIEVMDEANQPHEFHVNNVEYIIAADPMRLITKISNFFSEQVRKEISERV